MAVGASRKAMRDYKAMISHALKKLPANKVRKFTRGQNSRFGRA